MEEEIDLASWVTPTRFSIANGIVLAIQILKASPPRPTEMVRAALETIREAALHAQSVTRDRLRLSPENIRPLDFRLDSAWVGLRECIEAKARLEGTEVGERAAKLSTQVFPSGTNFVTASYNEQWAISDAHLVRIDEDELADEIDEIAGPEFLPFIREAHRKFGDAIGVGETARASVPDSAMVSAANLRLSRAIVNYGRVMIGRADLNDPKSVAELKRAMAPLDEYRRSTFAKRAAEEEIAPPDVDTDVSPTDPIPPVPAPNA